MSANYCPGLQQKNGCRGEMDRGRRGRGRPTWQHTNKSCTYAKDIWRSLCFLLIFAGFENFPKNWKKMWRKGRNTSRAAKTLTALKNNVCNWLEYSPFNIYFKHPWIHNATCTKRRDWERENPQTKQKQKIPGGSPNFQAICWVLGFQLVTREVRPHPSPPALPPRWLRGLTTTRQAPHWTGNWTLHDRAGWREAVVTDVSTGGRDLGGKPLQRREEVSTWELRKDPFLLVGAAGVGQSCFAAPRVHVPTIPATGLESQKTPRMRGGAIPAKPPCHLTSNEDSARSQLVWESGANLREPCFCRHLGITSK